MPYSEVKELPAYVQKYSTKVKRQWMHVFNTVFKSTNSELKAFRAANSVLKKRFKKVENNTREDRFNMLVDSFLGNLQG